MKKLSVYKGHHLTQKKTARSNEHQTTATQDGNDAPFFLKKKSKKL